MNQLTNLILTEKEGRWMLSVALLRVAMASPEPDPEESLQEVFYLDDSLNQLEELFTPEERVQLSNKLDGLHKAVGCSADCKHRNVPLAKENEGGKKKTNRRSKGGHGKGPEGV